MNPVPGQLGRLLQRAWFLEQMGGARDDLQTCLAAEFLHGLAVELDDDRILFSDDEQHRLAYPWGGTRRRGRGGRRGRRPYARRWAVPPRPR